MPNAIRNAKVVLGCLALWLVLHPYQGIWHDARLYTVAALRWLHPDAYARDVWFAFGSQDDLTLFSPLYATLIRLVEVSEAARTMVLLSAVGWVAAIWALCRELLSRRMAIAACLTLCMLPLWYSLSGTDIFQVSENFVTARMVAVPLSLFGLVTVHRRRILTGFALLLFAATMHPIMACGPIAVAICLCCTERLQVYLLAATLLAFVIALANPMGWSALKPIDGAWMELIQSSGASAFLYPGDLNQTRILGHLAVLLWAAALAPGSSARLYRAVALVVAWSLFIAVVVCFFYPSALLVQMQPWRSMWLAVVFAVPASVQIAVVAWDRGVTARWLLLLGETALICGGAWGAATVLVTWVICAVLPRATVCRLLALDLRSQRIFTAVGAILILLAMPTFYFELVGAGISAPGPALDGNWLYLLRAIGFYFLFPSLMWWILSLNSAWQNKAGLVLAVVLVASVIGFWDNRSDSKQLQEARYRSLDQATLFGGKVRPGETVYWPGNTLKVWFELGTSSYAGEEQAVGIVFSRPRTIELWRRMERIQQRSDTRDQLPQKAMRNLHRIDNSLPLTVADLHRLCADSMLDHVIDSSRLEGYFVARQESDIARRGYFYLYDCRVIRGIETAGGLSF